MKRTSEAALRNAEPLCAALRRVLPARGRVLEIGSGTGEHAVILARAFPSLEWRPSDADPDAREAIEERVAEARLPNLLTPLLYDLRVEAWRRRPADAVLCVNVLHAAAPECGEHLCAGAARILPPGGPLAVYGPFSRHGRPITGRLARVHDALRATDHALGVRDVEGLVASGERHGLRLEAEIPMPDEGDLLLVLRAAG